MLSALTIGLSVISAFLSGAAEASCSYTRNTWVNVTVSVDNTIRWSLIYVPSSAASTGAPLVMALHYWSGTAQSMMYQTMTSLDTDAGWITACPQGYENTWNAGLIAWPATTQKINDVGFHRALVKKLINEGCVDPSRVYVWGQSNGGFMAWRNACQNSDIFAAAVSCSGLMSDKSSLATYYTCNTSRPIPVMHFHGDADTTVPYTGIAVFGANTRGANESYYWWINNNGCTVESKVSLTSGTMTCKTPQSCPASTNVTLCTFSGGTHAISVDQSLIFKFFKTYTLDGSTSSDAGAYSSSPVAMESSAPTKVESSAAVDVAKSSDEILLSSTVPGVEPSDAISSVPEAQIDSIGSSPTRKFGTLASLSLALLLICS